MPKILLIENEDPTVQAIDHCLSDHGAEITTAADGAEGFQLVRDNAFDLIILSVELPRVSGYSVCNKLKKDPGLASIPLILISSDATPETFAQHKKLKTRAEGYLHKPIDKGELLRAVRELVSLAAGEEEALEDPEGLEVDFDEVDTASFEEVSIEDNIANLELPTLSADEDDFVDDEVLGSLEVLDAMENGISLESEGSDASNIDDEAGFGIELSPDEGGEDVNVDIDLDEDVEAERSSSLATERTEGVSSEPSPSSPYLSDGLLDTMRSEISGLRQKVRGLEETIEAKELEFSERLLEESTRARQAVGDRQKVSQLEHELEKAQALVVAFESKDNDKSSKISDLEDRVQASKVGHGELSATIERLSKELVESKNSQEHSESRVSELESKLDKFTQEVHEGHEQRNQAREIISSMIQVLDDLNRHPNSTD